MPKMITSNFFSKCLFAAQHKLHLKESPAQILPLKVKEFTHA